MLYNYRSTFITRLRLDEALDVVQPSQVLLLLLDVHVVGHKESKGLSDAALLQVPLEENLQVLVQAAKGRAQVSVLGFVRDVSRAAEGELGIVEVVEVLHDNVTVLAGRLDVERALAVLLHDDVQPARHGRLTGAIEFILAVELGVTALLAGRTIKLLITERRILVESLGVIVLEVGDRE